MDTDASVRALAPGSTFGGSRESLPLSVLSGQVDPSRQSISGTERGYASAERASVYSSSGLAREIPPPVSGVSALQSERNSTYYQRPGDAKSLRSITNIRQDKDIDARSITNTEADKRSQYDARSLHTGGNGKGEDVASLRSVDAVKSLAESRMDDARSGGVYGGGNEHARNGSITGVYAPSLLRQTSAAGTLDLQSRRSSNFDQHESNVKEHDNADGTKEEEMGVAM